MFAGIQAVTATEIAVCGILPGAWPGMNVLGRITEDIQKSHDREVSRFDDGSSLDLPDR